MTSHDRDRGPAKRPTPRAEPTRLFDAPIARIDTMAIGERVGEFIARPFVKPPRWTSGKSSLIGRL
jgi:hypothetical protein